MLTTIDLPDALFLESQRFAASRGATEEQVIVESVASFVHREAHPGDPDHDSFPATLPVIRSQRPGTLDLSSFDFDDLLA